MRPDVTCLSCGAKSPPLVLSLGVTPLANSFVAPENAAKPEAAFPLELVFCERCHLVQLSERVDPEILFRDYVYLTGTSSTMTRHHEELADHHRARFGLGATDLVVDIASNDGSLLTSFQKRGVRVLGVEPATNLAKVAQERGIPTENVFFGGDVAVDLRRRHGPAAVVCANNVLAHVPDLLGFLRGCRTLTEPAGVVSIEVPYLLPLLDKLEYDTIYHEHLSYFSVLALADAFGRAGLGIFDVQYHAVHGGTIRVLARAGSGHGPVVATMTQGERARGLDRRDTYLEFARRVEGNRTALVALLRDLRRQGKRIAAYGAPAKGNTLLNYCRIGTDLVEYTVDRNPLKVGKLTPGMHLPVRPRETLEQDRPDFALILPWNLTDEIMEQEAGYRRLGGRFLVPIPEPKILL